MVVLLQLFLLGFGAFQLAIMFSFYELMGVATNLLGGIAGSKWGLKLPLVSGLAIQIIGVAMLFGLRVSEWSTAAVIVYVTVSQALCGIAKDLVKLSGKSVTKLVKTKKGADDAAQSGLFKIVAWLTGSKNSVKGFGYFFGVALLQGGYYLAVGVILGLLVLTLIPAILFVDSGIGQSKDKTPLTIKTIFNKGAQVNMISVARLFLFGARDLWFEVVLPVYLRGTLGWSYFPTGFFLAGWVIFYGFVQGAAPHLVLARMGQYPLRGRGGPILAGWCLALAVMTAILAVGVSLIRPERTAAVWDGWNGAGVVSDGATAAFVVVGLFFFAFIFAVLSSLHSFLIVAYSGHDKVAQNVGFYYMANAAGRLVGVVISGVVYQYTGSARLDICLWLSVVFALTSAAASWQLGAVGESE
ncbi:hypothetical protein HDU93_003693, partial [Gonapodya sp. JEL0774]